MKEYNNSQWISNKEKHTLNSKETHFIISKILNYIYFFNKRLLFNLKRILRSRFVRAFTVSSKEESKCISKF